METYDKLDQERLFKQGLRRILRPEEIVVGGRYVEYSETHTSSTPSEFTIISPPFIDPTFAIKDSLWVHTSSSRTERSLSDMGVLSEGEIPYNDWRLYQIMLDKNNVFLKGDVVRPLVASTVYDDEGSNCQNSHLGIDTIVRIGPQRDGCYCCMTKTTHDHWKPEEIMLVSRGGKQLYSPVPEVVPKEHKSEQKVKTNLAEVVYREVGSDVVIEKLNNFLSIEEITRKYGDEVCTKYCTVYPRMWTRTTGLIVREDAGHNHVINIPSQINEGYFKELITIMKAAGANLGRIVKENKEKKSLKTITI